MACKSTYVTLSEACEILRKLRAPLTERRVRTLADYGIVRPSIPASTAGDSALYDAADFAVLYLWGRMKRAGCSYVQRALVIERSAAADVRAAVQRPGSRRGVFVVCDRPGLDPFEVSVQDVADVASQAAERYRKDRQIWRGHTWVAPKELAAQLAGTAA